MNKTRSIKEKELKNEWMLVDAKNVRLGKLATIVSKLLMGKDKVYKADNLFCGDRVIVINASLMDFNDTTRNKKMYYRHSNYPGGFKVRTLEQMMEKKPDYVVRQAVWGMLPKNKMGRRMLRNLKVFADAKHDLEAQQPIAVKI
jgi:large subunit ribosomal protein L13